MDDIYLNQYVPSIIKIGKRTIFIGLILMWIPCIILTIEGYNPLWGVLGTALIARWSSCALAYVIEPVSFYPALGLAGTYIANLQGSGSTLMVPCGEAAANVAGYEVGTPEGECAKAVGVAVGGLVKNILLLITVLLGSWLLSVTTDSFRNAAGYLIPALFGALVGSYVLKNWKLGTICLALSIVMTFLAFSGVITFLPMGVVIALCILISVFGSAFIGLKFFVPKKK